MKDEALTCVNDHRDIIHTFIKIRNVDMSNNTQLIDIFILNICISYTGKVIMSGQVFGITAIGNGGTDGIAITIG